MPHKVQQGIIFVFHAATLRRPMRIETRARLLHKKGKRIRIRIGIRSIRIGVVVGLVGVLEAATGLVLLWILLALATFPDKVVRMHRLVEKGGDKSFLWVSHKDGPCIGRIVHQCRSLGLVLVVLVHPQIVQSIRAGWPRLAGAPIVVAHHAAEQLFPYRAPRFLNREKDQFVLFYHDRCHVRAPLRSSLQDKVAPFHWNYTPTICSSSSSSSSSSSVAFGEEWWMFQDC
jgi:hypothetical protein